MIVVTGDVILTQGENVLTGGATDLQCPGPDGADRGGGQGRIRGVFYPNQRQLSPADHWRARNSQPSM
jgi:lipopolysaccharide export system protein LptA